MSAVIGELGSCSFTLNVSRDVNDQDLGLVKHFGVDEVHMLGPDKMVINSRSDSGHKGYWYDGKTVTYNTSGFLVGRSVVIDAGTLSTSMSLDELTQIRHVLLSHIHFDHIKGLPFLADTVFGKIPAPIEIHSLEEILAGLHNHLLNDTVWPDFTKLPNSEQPTFRLSELREDDRQAVGGLQVIPVRVNHIVPTVGFIIQDATGAVLYSGDTHETKRIWEVASKITHLKAAIIETSFPNDLHSLAAKSGHLTPRLLAQEFAKVHVAQRPVGEVGAEGDDEADAAALVQRGRHETVE